jgi:hypothetical protein
MQRTSTDLGKTWGTPLPLKPALGGDDGVLVRIVFAIQVTWPLVGWGLESQMKVCGWVSVIVIVCSKADVMYNVW